MTPLISIIVPVYNVAQYLNRCIQSLVCQTYQNIEIILIDDGSDDGSGQICDEWKDKDCRISVFHKVNEGIGSTRNAGIARSSGSYITFVDSDDYMPSDAVQVLFNRLVVDDSDLVIGKNMKVCSGVYQEPKLYAWMKDSVHSTEEVLMHGNVREYPVAPWAKLYKREILEGIYYPDLSCGEDLWVFPLIVSRCRSISIVDTEVYYYYQRSDSIMNTKSERQKEDEFCATLHMARFVMDRGYTNASVFWFSRAIGQAMQITDGSHVRRILAAFFDWTALLRIAPLLSWKRRIVLLGMVVPGLFQFISFLFK